MKKLLLPLILAASFQPVHAQDISASQCEELWSNSEFLMREFSLFEPGDLRFQVYEGWCRVVGARFETRNRTFPVYEIDSIEWRGDGLAGYVASNTPPTSFELRVRGFKVFAQIGEPVMDYVYRVHAERNGIDVDTKFTWDPISNVFDVEEVLIDFPEENGVRFNAMVDGVDLSSLSKNIDPTTLKLASFGLEIESNGLFEFYILPALAPAILGPTTRPEFDVAALKAKALLVIMGLDAGVFPAKTKQALSDLIKDMPLPAGTLAVEVVYENGFGIEDAMRAGEQLVNDPTGPFPVGMSVTATYTRTDQHP